MELVMTIGVVGILEAMVAFLFVEELALAELEPIETREPALFWLEAGVVGAMPNVGAGWLRAIDRS